MADKFKVKTLVALAVFLLLAGVGIANNDPPAGFRDIKWGAPPRNTLKKLSGPTDEGLVLYVPTSKKPEPLKLARNQKDDGVLRSRDRFRDRGVPLGVPGQSNCSTEEKVRITFVERVAQRNAAGIFH